MRTQLYIDGAWCDATAGGTFETINPATGEVIAQVANATAPDIDKAVKAARACLNSPVWGYASTGAQRAVVLRKLGIIVAARKDELAKLDSLDQGKPLRESQADVNDTLTACDHFAMLAEKLDAEQDEEVDNGTEGDFKTTVVREPVGVVGGITPWNYPLLMGVWKVLPALAAGCTIVLKPSELAPLSCLLLAEMLTDAGLPPGACNVLPGLGADAGAALSAHPDIDKISFTGSVPTARRIMAAAAAGPRAVSLELGGKSAMIVFEDAHLDGTVDWILTGILWGSGQVCSATSRVLVHHTVREALMEKLLARLRLVKMGNSLSNEMLSHEGPAMGPVVSRGQYDKVWGYIDEAMKEGVVVAYGGDREMVKDLSGGNSGGGSGGNSGGYFIPPTVFVDVPVTSRVWQEEIFGPVLCVREFGSEEEAIRLANDAPYGLAAAVMSDDVGRCARVGRRLRVGVVWHNCSQPCFIQAPWGGTKQSGFGRDLGRWGVEEFTCVKQVTACKNGFSWGLW